MRREFHPAIHPPDILLERVARPNRRVVFLLGSALTAPHRDGFPGVANVAQMIELARTELARSSQRALSAFDHLRAAEPDRAYQLAFEQVIAAAGQDTANRIVRDAVLAARFSFASDSIAMRQARDGDDQACKALESDIHGWYLPPGVQALARLIARERRPGTVLTTNFDPLIEIALAKTGAYPTTVALDGDGALRAVQSRTPSVVHLHGYWVNTDTLHTAIQLTQHRPRISHSLAELLKNSTLVVVGYGGWDDVLTDTLMNEVDGGLSSIDVLWTFYSSDSAQILTSKRPLIQRLERGLARGRVSLYHSVDTNTFFPKLETLVQEHEPLEHDTPISIDQHLQTRAQPRAGTTRKSILRKTILGRIAYCGPAHAGKESNVTLLHKLLGATSHIQVMQTKPDRGVAYLLSSPTWGHLGNFAFELEIRTIPTHPDYQALRKACLSEVTGIVFVADSHPSRMDANVEEMNTVRETLRSLKIDPPMVIQYNKRDLPEAVRIRELRKALNTELLPEFEADAKRGIGVTETFDAIRRVALSSITLAF